MSLIACVAWRFCRAGRTSGVAAKFVREVRENERLSREKNKNQVLPPQSLRGFCALACLYYLARPTTTAMLRRLCHWKFSWSCFHFLALFRNSQFLLGCFRQLIRHQITLWLHGFSYEIKAWAVFRIPKSRIPDSINKIFTDSGIWIPLHGVTPDCNNFFSLYKK